MQIAIVILAILVVVLVVYNIRVYIRVKALNNTNERINSLNILQDFMNIAGSDNTVDEKLQQINNKLIEKYEIKYSTIVVFNGAEYEIKATNVDRRHWEKMGNLQKEEIFKDCIVRGLPKYVTVEKDSEILSYQTTEVGRAKSAMFFPLYIENIYIGYWIIESGQKHAFDKLDLSVIEVVKENIISVLKTMQYQTTLESLARIDSCTGLNSGEYLYGKGKLKIEKSISSTVCMFQISNIKEINEEYNRTTGTQVLVEVTNIIKTNLSSEYLFVRYMGPKFVLVFIGEDTDEVTLFIKRIKKQVESQEIEVVEDKNFKHKNKKEPVVVKPKLNFVVATYYKGTALENTNKKLEEYLNTASLEESDINFI